MNEDITTFFGRVQRDSTPRFVHPTAHKSVGWSVDQPRFTRTRLGRLSGPVFIINSS